MIKDDDEYMIVVSKKFADDYEKTIGPKVNFDDIDYKIKGIYEISQQLLILLAHILHISQAN